MVDIDIYPRLPEFNSLLEAFPPKPANKFLPEWYKKQKLYTKKEMYAEDKPLLLKRCPAIVEELTRGIVVPSWSDVYIWKKDGVINWEVEAAKAFRDINWEWIHHQTHRQVDGTGLNGINNYGVLKLISPYLYVTPKDYGLYFKDAFYHHRQNVRLLSGYVETDIWHETNLPFEFITDINEQEEQTLMIKAGDPLFIIDAYKKTDKTNLVINKFDKNIADKHLTNTVKLNSMSEEWNRVKKFLI